MNKGKLTQNGVHLQDHEFSTVKVFLDLGYDIQLIPKSQIKNYRKPDIEMGGVSWEIKASIGDGKYTIQNTIQNAVGQSNSIIIDLRRCKMSDEKAVQAIEKEFDKSKHLKRLKIIKKSCEVVDFFK